MNITVKMDDTNWQNFARRAINILKSSNGLLKKAFLVVWPAEAAKHFDNEEGWNGPWAPWKESTRSSRIVHEIRSALGRQHAKGRLSDADTARGARKVGARQAKDYARGRVYGRGGKLLQVSGRLRTQTANDPIFTWTGKGLKVESPTPYSGFLDEGTKFMEARPFMWLGDDAQDTLSKVFADGLGDAADWND